MRDYNKMFHHGFGETDEEQARFWDFFNAVQDGDRYKLAMCEMNQVGAGKGVHVNPSAKFADYAYRQDSVIKSELNRTKPFESNSLLLDSDTFMEDQLEVMQGLVALRDLTFADANAINPDDKYTKLSWFLRNTQVLNHEPIDYNTTIAEWEHVHSTGTPLYESVVSGYKNIETLRDLAWYVHDDHPVLQWISVVNDMLAAGVDYYAGPNLEACAEGRFIVGGALDIHLLVAEIVRRASMISFYTKWSTWFPRPAYTMQARFGELLPLVFNDFNPSHPSNNAMHHAAAHAVYSAMIRLFDTEHVLPNGNTVGYELRLFNDNISYGRTIAGVHYPNDNEQYSYVFEAVGVNVWNEWISVR